EAAKNLSAAKELHIVSAPTTAAIGGVRAARNLIGGRGVNRVRDFKEMHDMLSRTQGTVYLGEETDKEGNKTGAKLFAKKISAKKALDEWKKNNYTP
ncbi:MAG: hypothetical protein KGH52_04075, partial [Candidatus Micrarchaeota archaeon]|nr:hypothetical protein [Candidatus Micrarchaeota archaeon]